MDRSVAAAAALIVIAGVAGCSQETKPERATSAKITVDGTTQTTEDISCTQVDWALTIKTTLGPSQTASFLQIGGQQPTAKTVNIENFNGFFGVAGEGVGKTDVALDKNDYVISGTAQGSDRDHPGVTRPASFRIQAHC
jgi:ipoprotein LpqH